MYVLFLAEGFEEVEALTPVDFLRRAGIDVKTVGIGGPVICGAHGIAVAADLTEQQLPAHEIDGVILPGGMPGTKHLEQSALVQQTVDVCAREGKLVAAICAAPSILGHKGLLQGRQAVCFPGFEADCSGARILQAPVVTDGAFITARGAGCAVPFAAAIIAHLLGPAAAQKVLKDVQWNDERYS